MEPTFLPSNRGVKVVGVDHEGKVVSLFDEVTGELFSKPADQCVWFRGDDVVPPKPAEDVVRHVRRHKKRRFKPPTVQLVSGS